MASSPTAAKAPPSSDPVNLVGLVRSVLRKSGVAEVPHCSDLLDKVLLWSLTIHLPLRETIRAFGLFKSQFVDWNDVRISSAAEVQTVLRAAEEPLELAIRLKEFLNYLFQFHHHVGLEFLADRTPSETKDFFRQKGFVPGSVVSHVLEALHGYPILPLESWTQPMLLRTRISSNKHTPLQRQKILYETVSPEDRLLTVFALHEHARATCGDRKARLRCWECSFSIECPFPEKTPEPEPEPEPVVKEMVKKATKKKVTVKKKAVKKKTAKKKAAKKTATKKKATKKKATKKTATKKKATKKNHQEENHQEENHQEENHQEENHQEENHQEENCQEENCQEGCREKDSKKVETPTFLQRHPAPGMVREGEEVSPGREGASQSGRSLSLGWNQAQEGRRRRQAGQDLQQTRQVHHRRRQRRRW